jgi:MFS family permease
VNRDTAVLLAARGVRAFASGCVSVVLGLYLGGLGYSPAVVGAFFTTALAGGAGTTTAVGLLADRWGRRTTLQVWAVLLAASGAALAAAAPAWVLVLVALTGTVSPSGYDVGPFSPLEQAALPQGSRRGGRPEVELFAWYNLVGTLAVALGSLAAGAVPAFLGRAGVGEMAAQRVVLWLFAASGLTLVALYAGLSPRVEMRAWGRRPARGLGRSRGVVLRLAGLFALDAVAGGLVVQSLVAVWFHQRFGVGLEVLGPLFFGTNLLSAVSYLLSAQLARRVGLLATMVFTHLPSNMLLAAVPFMPTWPAAAAVLLARHALSQMDVPARQAYTLALVEPSERSAAAALTSAVRPAGASVAPALTGMALQAAVGAAPFVAAGVLKGAYDLVLWALFRKVPLPEDAEETRRSRGL